MLKKFIIDFTLWLYAWVRENLDSNPQVTNQSFSSYSRPTSAQLCPYIQVDKLNEIGVYTPEQFNDLMAMEAKKSAPKFAEFLHKHQKTGYLYFGKGSKQQVFVTLRTFYPTMKNYSYGNFALYF